MSLYHSGGGLRGIIKCSTIDRRFQKISVVCVFSSCSDGLLGLSPQQLSVEHFFVVLTVNTAVSVPIQVLRMISVVLSFLVMSRRLIRHGMPSKLHWPVRLRGILGRA